MEIFRQWGPAVNALGGDGRLLFGTRMVRLFAYGFLSVVLVLYLDELGLTETQIGLLLTLTLVGDTAISLWITMQADRIGRRYMLIAGSALMVFAGVLFAFTSDFVLLIIAAAIGVISPSGGEVGPFLSIEQAALSQSLPAANRTRVFAWYNLVGSVATAVGALLGGGLVQTVELAGFQPLVGYRVVVLGYAALGLALACLFARLSPLSEAPRTATAGGGVQGLHEGPSRQRVLKLSALFSLDAFAGAFVVQSLVAYWFHVRYGVQAGLLGWIFFGTNILAAISALSAARVASKIGLIRTMVVTHLPSNVLLLLVPLMPNLPLAVAMLLLRSSISQMDVPTRQSYVMAVVSPEERSAAAGVTAAARAIGASLSPLLAGPMFASPLFFNAPFFVAGGPKIVYDLLLYRGFRSVRPPEEEGKPH